MSLESLEIEILTTSVRTKTLLVLNLGFEYIPSPTNILKTVLDKVQLTFVVKSG